MDKELSNRMLEGFIRFGKRTTRLLKFSSQTTMADINQHLLERFNGTLPENYHIEFYNHEAAKIFTLTPDIFKSVNNPFVSLSNIDTEEIESVSDHIELFIVNDSPAEAGFDLQYNTAANTISSSDLAHALLPPPIFPNQTTTHDDNSIDDILAEADETLPDYQLPTQPNEDMNAQIGRIIFSHDVHPQQKHHYLANRFSVEDGSDGKSGVSLIQGIKTKEEVEKKTPVSTCFQISRLPPYIQNIRLLIYAVYEEQNADMRIWYKHFHKGFLSHNTLKSNAKFVNPIILPLNSFPLNGNGDYVLNIYLLTERDKIPKVKEEIHRLSEEQTIQIHPAKHIQSRKRILIKPTRLLCFLVINNCIIKDTVGLSNFIQPNLKELEQQNIPAATPVRIELPPRKRRKT